MEKAAKAAIDYSFHMNLNHFNDKLAAELPSLMEMGIQTLKSSLPTTENFGWMMAAFSAL